MSINELGLNYLYLADSNIFFIIFKILSKKYIYHSH